MDSEAQNPTSAKTNAIIIPRIPQEIIDEILDHLAADPSELISLRSCSLVSKSWVPSCQRHLFYAVSFTSRYMDKWLKTFLAPEESPAHYVRDLFVWIGGRDRVPEVFFEYTLCAWFTNAENVTLFGHGGGPPSRTPSLWKLPQSITSLTTTTDMVTLVQIRDIMMQLPNLNDLSLSGSLIPVDRSALLGIGATLKGRFSGELHLYGGYADNNLMNMLLEVPTQLNFTAVQVCATYQCLLSTARLVEACGKTLVKILYSVSCLGKPHPLFWFN